ncbi:hypothetical protein [Borreliella valaisiana]|uniref:Uncharacterized protein n=2 Tax=Borreliella valaisiana TaxID=62088 RepID=C0R926_BORVA|nr:hypothetical protein [Borreliella valaisiana]ACN52980.1 hypothetical protein BVAVS116_H0111 [Borreliella valaisiana VS116]
MNVSDKKPLYDDVNKEGSDTANRGACFVDIMNSRSTMVQLDCEEVMNGL